VVRSTEPRAWLRAVALAFTRRNVGCLLPGGKIVMMESMGEEDTLTGTCSVEWVV
jgi:hypothetical protein